MSEFTTAQHVCELLGISRATLWRWENECADFPQPLRIGKVIRYSIPSIREFALARSCNQRNIEAGRDDLDTLKVKSAWNGKIK